MSFSRTGQTVDITTTTFPVRVEVLADDLVKVRFATQAVLPAEYTWSIAKSDWSPVDFQVSDLSDRLVIQAKNIQVSISKNPLNVSFLDANGKTLLQSVALSAQEVDDTINRPAGVREPRMVLGTNFNLDPQDHFYGLGEKVRQGCNSSGTDCNGFDQTLDWRGRKRDWNLSVSDMGNHYEGADGAANGNFVVPFVFNPRGYGLYLDTPYKTYWEFDQPNTWTVKMDCDQDWNKNLPLCQKAELRFYVMAGATPGPILSRFTELTGRAILPPRWMLGFLQSKNAFKNWEELNQSVTRSAQGGFPLDGIFLDLTWFGAVPGWWDPNSVVRPQYTDCPHRKIGTLDWSTTPDLDFSNAVKNMATLDAQGVKTVLIEEGYFDTCTANFSEASKQGFLARKDFAAPTIPAIYANGDDATDERSVGWAGQVGMIDTSNPAARAWFWSKHLPLYQAGAGAFWTDLGEPQDFRWRWTYDQGLFHQDVHNVWDMNRARSFFEGFAKDFPDRRPFVLSRSGYAGSQRFGVGIWSADAPSRLKWAAAEPGTQLNLAISGLPYFTSDIGGYAGDPVSSPRQFTRWLQMGLFSSLSRAHGKANFGSQLGRTVEPDLFPEPFRSINLKYMKWRERLVPYLYTHAREAYDTGMPIIRALVLQWPTDPAVTDLGSEYLFGPSILVAPVLTGVDNNPDQFRDVYLPAGEWVDLHDGTPYTGGQWLRHFLAPDDKLPLFAKQGSVIPKGPDTQHLDSPDWMSSRTLEIYPGSGADYSLYDDDGSSTAYLGTGFGMTSIHVAVQTGVTSVTVSPISGSFEGMPAQRTYDFELYSPVRPKSAQLDGKTLEIADASAPDGGAAAVYDSVKKKLLVHGSASALSVGHLLQITYP